jgi:hypothetical protein
LKLSLLPGAYFKHQRPPSSPSAAEGHLNLSLPFSLLPCIAFAQVWLENLSNSRPTASQ